MAHWVTKQNNEKKMKEKVKAQLKNFEEKEEIMDLRIKIDQLENVNLGDNNEK